MEITCGIYLYSTEIDRVLVGHVTNQNAWSIPKGHYEDTDKSYFACANRELWEETNISLSDLNILEKHEFDFTMYKSNKKKIIPQPLPALPSTKHLTHTRLLPCARLCFFYIVFFFNYQ
jgi:8-oxo-dGTP pyrophosphatase MutT (NUDIX family)